MRNENLRLFHLWDIRVKVISKAISRPNKADIQMEVNKLSQDVDRLGTSRLNIHGINTGSETEVSICKFETYY